MIAKAMLCSFGVYVGLAVAGRPGWAQTARPDSSLQTDAGNSLRQHYTQGLGYESGLYTGPEYVNYVKRYIVGHPFLGAGTPQEGTLDYAGFTYLGLPLRYDLVLDQVVLKSPSGGLDMSLVNEKVSRFTIGPHTFIRLAFTDSATAAGMRTGFYELLADGPVRLLALRRKEIQERAATDGMEGHIDQKNKFFINTRGQYYEVSKAKTVVTLFPEKKADLRKYIRSQHLTFSKATREKSLVTLARYISTLAQPVP
ncbi:hypothetical protein GCM10027346_17800 [Hymenobacter seoulensis]